MRLKRASSSLTAAHASVGLRNDTRNIDVAMPAAVPTIVPARMPTFVPARMPAFMHHPAGAPRTTRR